MSCIGAGVVGVAGESNTTRIRNVYASAVSGLAFYVDSAGKLGHLSSSQRYKEEIKPLDKASEKLFGLKPVTFHYKKEIDPARERSFGLIELLRLFEIALVLVCFDQFASIIVNADHSIM